MVQSSQSTEVIIANELNVEVSRVVSAIRLIDEGATVPFIARYRKEATKGLDDTQLRRLLERLHYLRDLDERRTLILKTIQEQGKLTPLLEEAIHTASTKTRLEDLYLPYRPKRHTKALLAKEAGLEPLALALWKEPERHPEIEAAGYVNEATNIHDVSSALEGARHILIEQFAEDPELIHELRQFVWQEGVVKSVGSKKRKPSDNKYADYYNYAEPIKSIPSHRALALFRGRRESVLQMSLSLPNHPDYAQQRIATYFNITDQQRPADTWLMETVRITWKQTLFTKLELELLARLRELADEEAIRVFAGNLRDLLLAAPAGPKITIGLDPGIRTGVKVVVVDSTGKVLDYTTVFPLAPQNDWHGAIASIAKLAAKYTVNLISIGNGTGSRETDRLVMELIKMYPDLALTKVMVSEAGASVYSASELAAAELPELDVTIRGAVSIARRLQDPLSELVKIEPKSIGVGQYQHDVNQSRLAHSLDGVVEDCVNSVGVDVNTASVALLRYVSGLNQTLANNLVLYREEHGAYTNREQLKQVARMGERSYQQAAGFLRVNKGDNPLDATGVHPEAYPLVDKILADNTLSLDDIKTNPNLLQAINKSAYVNEQYGLPTINDILQELEKPGRDPRPTFKTACFQSGIDDINDLELGMILEGVVSNVTNFGAFVDIGVHQDGLVHISAMTHRFIQDTRDIVKTGQVVQVKVIEVDKQRRRIGLSMKLDEEKPANVVKKVPFVKKQVSPPKASKKVQAVPPKPATTPKPVAKNNPFNSAMADAFSKLKREVES